MAKIRKLIIPRRSNQYGETNFNCVNDPSYLEAGQQSEMLLTRARELLGINDVEAGRFYEDAGYVWNGLGKEHPDFFNDVSLQLTRIQQERYRMLGFFEFK